MRQAPQHRFQGRGSSEDYSDEEDLPTHSLTSQRNEFEVNSQELEEGSESDDGSDYSSSEERSPSPARVEDELQHKWTAFHDLRVRYNIFLSCLLLSGKTQCLGT